MTTEKLPYFSVDNAHPKLCRHSFWLCLICLSYLSNVYCSCSFFTNLDLLYRWRARYLSKNTVFISVLQYYSPQKCQSILKIPNLQYHKLWPSISNDVRSKGRERGGGYSPQCWWWSKGCILLLLWHIVLRLKDVQ
jgi:hypothetical protein